MSPLEISLDSISPQLSIHVDRRAVLEWIHTNCVALQWTEVGDPWYTSQELALNLSASSIQYTISHSLFPQSLLMSPIYVQDAKIARSLQILRLPVTRSCAASADFLKEQMPEQNAGAVLKT